MISWHRIMSDSGLTILVFIQSSTILVMARRSLESWKMTANDREDWKSRAWREPPNRLSESQATCLYWIYPNLCHNQKTKRQRKHHEQFSRAKMYMVERPRGIFKSSFKKLWGWSFPDDFSDGIPYHRILYTLRYFYQVQCYAILEECHFCLSIYPFWPSDSHQNFAF